LHPDRMLERVIALGTKVQVDRAEHKHRDLSRLVHDDGSKYAEKTKALASIMVGLEREMLEDCNIVAFRDCRDSLEQIEIRYKHTEVQPLYHRITLDFAFLDGEVPRRIVDLPVHADWLEVDVFELEGAITALARLWLDRLGLTGQLTAENVAYH